MKMQIGAQNEQLDAKTAEAGTCDDTQHPERLAELVKPRPVR